MKCHFCGFEFEQGREGCSSCPFGGKCRSICCPNCGCEVERKSKLADLARKLFRKGEGSR